MNESQNPANSRLDAVVAEFLEAAETGQPPDREAILQRFPQFANTLRAFFADHDRMLALADSTPPAGPVTPWDQTLSLDSFGHSHRQPDNGDADSPREPRRSQFGDYELLDEVARGGMGVVYKARQVSLNRVVALKMILAGRFAHAEDVQRFRAEAEAAANLDHPGIVPIYEVGQFTGQHFFSMGFVDGESLAQRLTRGPLPPREAAEMLLQVAEAVAFAHDRGVIHRDLKPGNILLSRSGDTYHPKVTDFGLAKRVDDDSGLTTTGQILGTPAYMPPEQATGDVHHIGPHSDIYALGAILYEALTGQPPFRGARPLEVIAHVLDSDPTPPRQLNPAVPRDLETIVLKCLQKQAESRYESATELCAELRRYLDGEAIHATTVRLMDRVTRAIGSDRHEQHFRGWGQTLVLVGLTILAAHVAIFALDQFTKLGLLWRYWLPRAVMFVVLFGLLSRSRTGTLWPRNAAERLVWVVWIGYLAALGAATLVLAVRGHAQHEVYAFSAVLSGLAFFIMGAHVWGGSYLIGLVFLLAAPLLAILDSVSSLGFGLLWAVATMTLGWHYRRLA